MLIFLDTADVDEIREAISWGVVDGVTTNPTHVSNTGRSPRDLYKEICSLTEGPVSLECLTLEADAIVSEARELAKIADNAVIKVPLMLEGLKAVKQLAAEGIKTNVTTVFSAPQALLAAKCGATYVSPVIGRLDNAGHLGMDVIHQIRTIFDNYNFDTQILAAAIRHPTHVLEASMGGADICTMRIDVLQMLYEHPFTEQGIQMFLEDWKKVPQD
jgi:transaldolase